MKLKKKIFGRTAKIEPVKVVESKPPPKPVPVKVEIPKVEKLEVEMLDEEIARKMHRQYLKEHRSFTKQFLDKAPIDTNLLIGLGYVKNTDGGWDWQGIQPA